MLSLEKVRKMSGLDLEAVWKYIKNSVGTLSKCSIYFSFVFSLVVWLYRKNTHRYSM